MVNIVVNPVLSAYGKKENAALSMIKTAYEDGRILQAEKNRSQISPSDLWTQCPEGLWSSPDFKENIARFKNAVKRFAPKEKQIAKAWDAVSKTKFSRADDIVRPESEHYREFNPYGEDEDGRPYMSAKERDIAEGRSRMTENGRQERIAEEQTREFIRAVTAVDIVPEAGFGEVSLNNRSVRSDIAHGIGRAKAATFAAVPGVIQNGKQIDFQENWKGRRKDSYVFAGPVEFEGQKTYVAAVVLKGEDRTFYLHEVVDSEGNLIYIAENPGAVKTMPTAQGGIAGDTEVSANTISQDFTESKENSAGRREWTSSISWR